MLALALLLVAAFAQGSLSFQLTGGLFQDLRHLLSTSSMHSCPSYVTWACTLTSVSSARAMCPAVVAAWR